jgi:hypothetical protein
MEGFPQIYCIEQGTQRLLREMFITWIEAFSPPPINL